MVVLNIKLIAGVLVMIAAISPARANEYSIGNANAPVTIVEYASMTCDYCVSFHRKVFPLLKSRYIDSGHVRFVYRDFPTSAAARRGAIAARCAGDRYFTMLDALYETVGSWTRAGDIDTALTQQAVALGIDGEPFRACLNDSRHASAIADEKRSATEFGVLGTPTFVINGMVERGLKDIDELEVLIETAPPREQGQ